MNCRHETVKIGVPFGTIIGGLAKGNSYKIKF